MKRFGLTAALLASLATMPLAGYAEEEEHTSEEFDGDNTVVEVVQAPKVNREKKAEGTPARDRFEAETVIKSRYGTLDVDPD